MEENGGSAPPHKHSCPTKQYFLDHRCTQIQSLIRVHLRASVVDFPCSPTVRPNVGVYFHGRSQNGASREAETGLVL
jgi:hypothetical protein